MSLSAARAWSSFARRVGLGLALIVAAGAGGACRRAEAPRAPRLPASPAAAPVATRPASQSAAVLSPAAAPSPAAALSPGETLDDAALVGEARDRDPRSETVTIKLIAETSRKARVFWGRKDLGLAPLEVTRPRNSGPLDLLVLAPGYLPLHTRVFTDRDDKIALRLTGESDGPGLFGYRADQVPAPPKPSRTAVPQARVGRPPSAP